MLPANVPIWATGLAAGFMPVSLIALANAISPRDTGPRSYGTLGALAVLTSIPAPHIGSLISQFVDPIANPVSHAIASSFAFSFADQFLQFIPFYIWLAGFRRKTSQHCICGAVTSSLILTMTINFFSLQLTSSDASHWFHIFIYRSLLQVPSIAVSAMIIGLWTAVVVQDWRTGNAWPLVAGLTVIELGDGLWFTAAKLQSMEGVSVAVWLSCFVISAILRTGAVVLGIRALARRGVNLRIPRALWS